MPPRRWRPKVLGQVLSLFDGV